MGTYKSLRAKSCDISDSVKRKVWERDNHRCVLCLSSNAKPNAHFIPRSKGGLGVEKNILTLCPTCHSNYDQTTQRRHLQAELREYLIKTYCGDWDEAELYYRR